MQWLMASEGEGNDVNSSKACNISTLSPFSY